MRSREWLQSAGIAALVLFPFYYSVIDRPGDVRMHAPASITTFVLSLIANLALVSFIFLLLAFWLRTKPGWTWLKILQPAVVFACLAEMIYLARHRWISFHPPIVVLAVVTILTLLLHWRWRRGERLLLQLSSATLIGLGFFCVFVVIQLLHLAMWRPLPNSTNEAATNRTGQPRIVWILFDELSYQQVFEERYPNLQLPNFDEFSKSSTLFTNTQPSAYVTEQAIPSILLGQVVNRVTYTTKNRIEVGSAAGAMYSFDAAQTPFALARRYGLTTGVVGWYNPYCSMLAPYLNQCYWTDELQAFPISAREDFWQNFLHPWILYGRMLSHPRRMMSNTYRTLAYQDVTRPWDIEKIQDAYYRVQVHQDLMRHAERILESSGPDFVFLHLPLPHPPGFYNRETQQFDSSGNRSYVDNLALMDKTLGQLLTILKQSPRWKYTNVIICGDHSWRVPLWAGSKYWTAEDESASHGRAFDQRPLLMIHLAGQTTPAIVTAAFPLLRVHTILDDLVEGKQPSFSSANDSMEKSALQ